MSEPKKNGDNGDEFRGADGKFLPGNPGGPGRPPKATRFFDLAARAVKDEELVEIIRNLAKRAKEDTAAATALFDRLFGRPVALDVLYKIEAGDGELNHEIEALIRELGIPHNEPTEPRQ